MSWTSLLLLAGGAYALKLAGVMGLGRFINGERSIAIGRLLPPALLMALVMLQTFTTNTTLTLDARAAGVSIATLAALKQAPFWLVVTLAATTTALLRALT